jgi:hypothetical protein
MFDATPSHVDEKEFMSWNRFTDEMRSLRPDQLERVIAGLLRRQNEADKSFVKPMERQIAAARFEGDLWEEVVLIALQKREILAYVLRPNTDSAYKILAGCWGPLFHSLHDRYTSIRDGTLRINTEAARVGGKGNIGEEVVNRPLVVRVEGAHRLMMRGPPSDVETRRVGQEIVESFQRAHPQPHAKMKQKEFIRRICDELPLCKKNKAEAAWEKVVPPSWRRSGRRHELT